jgi:hypothetical protein
MEWRDFLDCMVGERRPWTFPYNQPAAAGLLGERQPDGGWGSDTGGGYNSSGGGGYGGGRRGGGGMGEGLTSVATSSYGAGTPPHHHHGASPGVAAAAAAAAADPVALQALLQDPSSVARLAQDPAAVQALMVQCSQYATATSTMFSLLQNLAAAAGLPVPAGVGSPARRLAAPGPGNGAVVSGRPLLTAGPTWQQRELFPGNSGGGGGGGAAAATASIGQPGCCTLAVRLLLQRPLLLLLWWWWWRLRVLQQQEVRLLQVADVCPELQWAAADVHPAKEHLLCPCPCG